MSIRAEIKQFHIWGGDLEYFYPEDPEYFYATVDMAIGPADSEGGDNFSVMVCTPRWFEENIMTKRPSHPTHETVRRNVFGRHYLFVHSFDEAEIRKEVQLLVDRVRGEDWHKIALRLSRYFGWEFEDYDDYCGLPPHF